MRTDILLRGRPKWLMRFVIEKILKKDIFCMAKAKRNLVGNEINIFDFKFRIPVSIQKGDEFFVIIGTEDECRALEHLFKPFPVTVYQLEYIICQTKWKGQPYKFFFKDMALEK